MFKILIADSQLRKGGRHLHLLEEESLCSFNGLIGNVIRGLIC